MILKYQSLDSPLISIVICNYNHEIFIKSAIVSALNQTYKPFEIIVVDDGSTDDSIEIISTFSDQIKFIQKENGGQISAYNVGFKVISGNVVLFLDADDVLMPHALEEISKKFEQDVVKVHYKMQVIDQNGEDLNTTLPSILDSGDCSKNLIRYGLMYKAPPASGNAYRVEALSLLFPLPELTYEKHSADYFCIYGIALLGKIASINDPLFKYRVNTSNEYQYSFGNALNNYDFQEAAEIRWRIFRKWIYENDHLKTQLPLRFHDFTIQKLFYANAIHNSNTLWCKTKLLKEHFLWVLKAINLRKDFSILKKILLVCWMLAVYICPNPISSYLIKKVCNPVRN